MERTVQRGGGRAKKMRAFRKALKKRNYANTYIWNQKKKKTVMKILGVRWE